MGCQLFGAVNLQVAHHDDRLPAKVEINKSITDEQSGGVKHVGVALAVRDHEEGVWHNGLWVVESGCSL